MNKIQEQKRWGYGTTGEDAGLYTERSYAEWWVIQNKGWEPEILGRVGLIGDTVVFMALGNSFQQCFVNVYPDGNCYKAEEIPLKTDKKGLYTNETDTVIATCIPDAIKVYIDYTGADYDFSWDPWREIAPLVSWSVMYEDFEGKPETGDVVIPPDATITEAPENDGGYVWEVTARAERWAEVNEPVFLCSTEY